MKTNLEISEPYTVDGIWPLISDVMTHDLCFPWEAVDYFSQIFTDEELIRRIKCPDTPVYIASKKRFLGGAIIGSSPEGGVGTIIWLIVSSEFRRRGVGEALFKQTCKAYYSMGCHKVKLTASTEEAVKFYEKLGMSVEGQHISHWWKIDFWSLGKLLP